MSCIFPEDSAARSSVCHRVCSSDGEKHTFETVLYKKYKSNIQDVSARETHKQVSRQKKQMDFMSGTRNKQPLARRELKDAKVYKHQSCNS